jgi:hypothetical protein
MSGNWKHQLSARRGYIMFIGKCLLSPPHALGEVGVNVNEITACKKDIVKKKK